MFKTAAGDPVCRHHPRSIGRVHRDGAHFCQYRGRHVLSGHIVLLVSRLCSKGVADFVDARYEWQKFSPPCVRPSVPKNLSPRDLGKRKKRRLVGQCPGDSPRPHARHSYVEANVTGASLCKKGTHRNGHALDPQRLCPVTKPE